MPYSGLRDILQWLFAKNRACHNELPLQFIPFVKAIFSNTKYTEQFHDKTVSMWQWKPSAAELNRVFFKFSLAVNYHRGRVFLKQWKKIIAVFLQLLKENQESNDSVLPSLYLHLASKGRTGWKDPCHTGQIKRKKYPPQSTVLKSPSLSAYIHTSTQISTLTNMHIRYFCKAYISSFVIIYSTKMVFQQAQIHGLACFYFSVSWWNLKHVFTCVKVSSNFISKEMQFFRSDVTPIRIWSQSSTEGLSHQ